MNEKLKERGKLALKINEVLLQQSDSVKEWISADWEALENAIMDWSNEKFTSAILAERKRCAEIAYKHDESMLDCFCGHSIAEDIMRGE